MNIMPFAFGDHLVRVFMRDNEPWFVLSDVCRVLELGSPHKVAERLDDDEKGRTIIPTPGGPQEMTIISESGLYALVMTSRKPEAKRFRKWVTAEVLPSIRKTGGYAAPGALPPRPTAADIPLDVVRSWTNAIRETRILRGSRAAVAMWNASPFADLVNLPDFPAGSHLGGPGLDGDGCLAHLLELPVKGFGRLWEAAAAHWSGQPGARGAAKAAGVLLDPADLPGWAAVANKTPDLVRHFHGTAWAAGWNRALASLEGAARTDRVFWFTDRPSRAILLPRALFNPGE